MRLTTGAPPGARRRQGRSRGRRAAVLAAVVLMLAMIFALDRATGSTPVQHLYYLPIVVAAAEFGIWGGVAAPAAAIALYHAADPRLLSLSYGHWDIVQIALFLAIGVVTARLTTDRRRLQLLAATDDLTGLHNLRSFEAELQALVRGCQDTGNPLSLLVLDVDHLKSLNDAYGHLAGAEAVRTIGHIIGAAIPDAGVACRYGGDEFVVALPGCPVEQARAVADWMRRAVHAATPTLAGLPFPARTLSISVGIACGRFDSPRDPAAELGETLFRAADRALYEAKRLGRNHVHVA